MDRAAVMTTAEVGRVATRRKRPQRRKALQFRYLSQLRRLPCCHGTAAVRVADCLGG